MKNNKMTKIGQVFGRITFKVRDKSPEILLVLGIVGTVASTVLACRASTKAEKILGEMKDDLEPIHKVASDPELSKEYSEKDQRKDTALVYMQTGVKFARLYAPSVVLGSLSIASILAGNRIQKMRYAALGAAYATLDKGFKDYRTRVIERLGEDTEKEIRYGLRAKEIERTVKDENGEEKTVRENALTVEKRKDGSDYSRFFDENCRAWERDNDYNFNFLNAQQQAMNDKLRARGYLFLNEVYEALGIAPTRAGQIVGWVYNPKDKNHKGDNFVDFGIYMPRTVATESFLAGDEKSILLDFNVDGPILGTFEKYSDFAR